MGALGQCVSAATAHVYLEQLAFILLRVGLKDQRRVPRAEHILLPGVRRKARLYCSGLPALERSLLALARGADCLEELLLPAYCLSEWRGMVPLDISIKDAAAEVAAAVLLL